MTVINKFYSTIVEHTTSIQLYPVLICSKEASHNDPIISLNLFDICTNGLKLSDWLLSTG